MAEERNGENTPPPLWPLKEHYTPSEYVSTSCIQLPIVQAAQYEIKPSTIHLLPSFHGLSNEDSYNHIDDFLVICSTVKINNVNSEAFKMFLFPFSLKDKAKYVLAKYFTCELHHDLSPTTTKILRQVFLCGQAQSVQEIHHIVRTD